LKLLHYIFVLILLTSSDYLSACDCKELGGLDSLREKGFRFSDLVFHGELLEITDSSFSIRVIESFKGEYQSETIIGKAVTSCSLFPKHKGQWIIYANYNTNETYIDISQCLSSRSRVEPWCTYCYDPPPPPQLKNKMTKEEKLVEERAFNQYERDTKMKAVEDWDRELVLLRQMRELRKYD